MKRKHIYEMKIVFFLFHLTFFMNKPRNQKNSCPNVTKWCQIICDYDVYIIYTTILNLDYWMKIKNLANWSGCKSLDILTICLHFDHSKLK